MYVRTDTEPHYSQLGDFGWWVRSLSGVVPEGHEVMTRAAASGLALSAADLAALIEGVRRPDTTSYIAHVLPAEQKRHFLRGTLISSTARAYSEAIDHLRDLHRRILASLGNRPEQFRLIGEALHLIQDSFAPAHVQRDSSGRIRYIRNFGPVGGAPGEHAFPVDPRDDVHGGIIRRTLKPEARAAIAASRDYLQVTLRHIAGGVPPATITSELNSFIARHLAM